MGSALRRAVIGLVLVSCPVAAASARDVRTKPVGQHQRVSAQERASQAAADRFSARMGRLDALMGGQPRGAGAPLPRARSANAEP